MSPLRNAWKILSTSSGCRDQIAPPPLLGDRCILGDLPPVTALERRELRAEEGLKKETHMKIQSETVIYNKEQERFVLRIKVGMFLHFRGGGFPV